jgi:hypothetical protein
LQTIKVLEQFERRDEKLAPQMVFYKRLILFELLSLGIILFSLGIGIPGYISFEGMGLVDAFLNAAMIMGGMGPVSVLYTDGGKIFAGLYAMFCGFVLIFPVAIFMTPESIDFSITSIWKGGNNCLRFFPVDYFLKFPHVQYICPFGLLSILRHGI